MFTIQQRVTIAQLVDQVFAFLASPDDIPRWRPDVVEVRSRDVPLQVGSEFDEVINFGGLKTQTFRVAAYEAQRLVEVTAIAGLGIRPTQRYTVSSSAGSTTVSIQVTVRAQGVFRLLEPLLAKMIAAKWRDYSVRLKTVLENPSEVPPNAPPRPTVSTQTSAASHQPR
jgi:uncharacterized protein YndB with AHSA1/START domain